MIYYIKDFKIQKVRKSYYLRFEYFLGYSWRQCKVKTDIKNMSVAATTTKIIDYINDELKEDNVSLDEYTQMLAVAEQLNRKQFDGCSKLAR